MAEFVLVGDFIAFSLHHLWEEEKQNKNKKRYKLRKCFPLSPSAQILYTIDYTILYSFDCLTFVCLTSTIRLFAPVHQL